MQRNNLTAPNGSDVPVARQKVFTLRTTRTVDQRSMTYLYPF